MSKLPPHQRKLKALRAANKSVENMKLEAAQTAVMTLYIMLLYVMYFHYGWKRKRLSRVLMQFRQVYEAVASGERSLDKLADEIRTEAGIDINIKTGQAKVLDI